MITQRTWCALGSRVTVLAATNVRDADAIADQAAAIVATQLDELDAACSRFRADPEMSRLRTGTAVTISQALSRVLAADIRTARRTDGLVDFTVGPALAALGDDDDLDRVRSRTVARGASSAGSRLLAGLHDEVTTHPLPRPAL